VVFRGEEIEGGSGLTRSPRGGKGGGAGPGDNRWQGGTSPQAAERLRLGISNGIGGANMWASGYSAPV
jgi:hypothetical protein